MERLRFVAIVIPAVTVLGIILRVLGWSPEATAAVMLVIIAIATATWYFGPDFKRAREAKARGLASSSSPLESADHPRA